MSTDPLSFRIDTTDLTRAVRALDQVTVASTNTEAAAGRLRAANGRFLPVARQATDAATQQRHAIAELGTSMTRTGGSASQLAGVLQSRLSVALAGVASFEAIRRTVMLADEYQRMGARLRVVSQSAGQAAAAQQQLVKLALETRSPLLATVTSFARIAAAADALGVSQDRVLTVTRTLAQTFQLSGATAAEAASSAQQLTQAIGSGTLSGDELRATLENNLVLAKAIAASFGVSVGELKKMGAEGKLTGAGVFAGIERQSAKIGEQFALIPPNLESATTNLATAVQAMLGRLDTATGLTATIARNLDRAAQAMPGIAMRAESYVDNVRRSLPGYLGGTDTDGRRNAWSALFGGGMDPDTPARPIVRRAGVLDTVRVMAQGPKVLSPEERERLGRERLQRLGRTIDAAGETLDRVIRDVNDVDDEMRRRRVAAGLESGDPVLDSRLRTLEASVGAELRGGVRGASTIESRIGVGKNNIVDASAAFGQRLAEEATKRAQEMRTLFTEQLARGVQDGLTQPIARFLRTWQLNVKTLGDALRDALINAVSAALANALTRRLVELFERMSPKTSKLGLTTQLAAAFAGGGNAFGGGGGFGGLPIPGLRLPFGGGGGAGNAGAAAAKAAAKNGAATAAAGKSLSLSSGLGAFGVGIGVGGALGRSRGTGAGVLGGAASGAIVGAMVGGPVGAAIGGLAGVVGGLLGGNARRRARRAEAEARRESSRSLLEELGIRNAAAAGDDSQAERLRLEAQQRRELAEIVKQFGERSREVAALRNTQAAELRALADSALGPGTYLGPDGFSAARYRFDAGRPAAPAITGNTFNITVPEGTTSEQARALLDEFGRMATQQGLPASEWSRVQVS